MKSFYITLFICSCLGSLNLFAQETIENPPIEFSNVIPPSPTSSALGKYGVYEVSQATGIPNISIPLLQLDEGNYKLPISLSYHAAGNKVDEIGSWVGLGWSLMTGGVITRTVKGLPDEVNEGGVHEGFLNYGIWLQNSETFTEEGDLESLTHNNYWNFQNASKGRLDTEPDEFSFNFAGLSGSFVLDKNLEEGLEVHLLPNQPIRIQPVISGDNIESFYVYGSDGTIYFFEENEKTEFMFNHELSFISTWHLTKIVPITGGEITFVYGSHNLEFNLKRSLVRYYEINQFGNLIQPGSDYTPNIQQIKIPQSKKLRYINYNQGQIEFDWESVGDKGAKLNEIIQRDRNNVIRNNIDFYHGTFSSIDNGYNRLKLNGLSINGEEYDFKYENTAFPPLESNNKDHWGYYNGANNISGIPTYIYDNDQPIGDNADHMPNGDAMKIGILEEIKYPTGGTTRFEYEPNTYYNFDGIVKINQEWTFRHEHTNGEHSSYDDFSWPQPIIISSDPNFNIDFNDITWLTDKVYVEFGTNDDGLGQPIEYTDGSPFAFFNGTQYTNGTANNLGFDAGSGFHKKYHTFYPVENNLDIRLKTGSVIGNYVIAKIYSTGSFEYPYPLYDDGHILIGGLRVKSIKNYDVNGEFISGKVYSYDVKDNNVELHPESSAQMLIGNSLIYADNALPYLDAYSLEQGCWDPFTTNTQRYTLYESPKGNFGQGSIVMYEKVKEIRIGSNWTSYDDNDLGSIVSIFEVIPDPSFSLNYPYPARMDFSHLRGQISVKKYYDNKYKLLKEENYHYSTTNNLVLKGAKIIKNRGYYHDFNYDNDPIASWGGRCGTYNLYNINQFNYFIYQYWASFKHLDSAIYKDYSETGTLITKKEFSYNLQYQQLTQERIITPNRIIRKETIYPFDLNSGISTNPIYNSMTSMVNQNALIYPIEERTLLEKPDGDELLYAKFTNYLGYKPSKIYQVKAESPIPNFTNIEEMVGLDDAYEENRPDLEFTYSSNRIVTQEGTEGIPTTYLWSHDEQYPVLKIENVTYLEIVNAIGVQLISDLRIAIDLNLVESKTENVRATIATSFPDKLITSYTYIPLIGIKTIKDPNGRVMEYFYDDKNRLSNIKEPDGVVKSYQYHTVNSKR